MTKTDKAIVARMKEIRDLLVEFGAQLVGYDPGVTADIVGRRLERSGCGAGWAGEHMAFDGTEWAWLEPLLKELQACRKNVSAQSRNT
jgi:hypothetical protein